MLCWFNEIIPFGETVQKRKLLQEPIKIAFISLFTRQDYFLVTNVCIPLFHSKSVDYNYYFSVCKECFLTQC